MDEQSINLRVRVFCSQRKTTAIRVVSADTVEVRVPLGTPREEVDKILVKHWAWIEKRLIAFQNSQPVARLTEEDIQLLAMQAKEELPPLVARFARQLGVTCGRITIRCQKSRWGSCSAKGNLNFNCLLMLTPPEVRMYVVAHELCHRLEMNHSDRFWYLLEQVLPDYRSQVAWLKQYGPGLINRLPEER